MLVATICVNAQTTRVSLSSSVETSKYFDGYFNIASVGIQFERQYSDRFGLLFGAENTNRIHQYFIESRVNLPLMAKFYSKPVNIAMGPYVDIFAGMRSSMNIADFSTDMIYWGALLDISHQWDITKSFSVEPGIRLRYGMDDLFAGLNVSLKYHF